MFLESFLIAEACEKNLSSSGKTPIKDTLELILAVSSRNGSDSSLLLNLLFKNSNVMH